MTYVAVLLVVINFDFIVPRMAPGNASQLLVPNYANPQLQHALLAQRFGLNQPIVTQYVKYLAGIFTNFPPNFGFSYQYYPTPVSVLLETRIVWTMGLVLASLALSFVVAYLMVVVTALRRGGKAETGATITSIFLQATPAYFSGLILLWIFAVTLNWLPVFGKVNPGAQGLDYIVSVVVHGILPVATLTGAFLGQTYLLLRGSVQETLKSDYVVAASLRGIPNRQISIRYVLRNALIPVVSVLSFSLAGLVSLSVLVEAVFGYAGLGDLVVDGALNRDYPVLEGSLFAITVMVIIGGLIGDIILTRLDPKLRK